MSGLGILVQEMLVDLIGDHPNAVLEGPLADRPGFSGGVDAARRIRRRAVQEDLRALGARSFELFDADLVVLLGAGENGDGDAAGEFDDLGVGRPVGGRQEGLVARVEDGGECLEDGLLAAVGHENLSGIDLISGVSQSLLGNCRTQLGQTSGGRVAVHRGFTGSAHGRFDDRFWGREIGFARTESDDGASLGFEGFGLRVNGKGGRRSDGSETCGDPRTRACAHTSIVA